MHISPLSCDQNVDVLDNSLLVNWHQLNLVEFFSGLLHTFAVVHDSHHPIYVFLYEFDQKTLIPVLTLRADLILRVQILIYLLHLNHLPLDDKVVIDVAGPMASFWANLAIFILHCTTILFISVVGVNTPHMTAEFACHTRGHIVGCSDLPNLLLLILDVVVYAVHHSYVLRYLFSDIFYFSLFLEANSDGIIECLKRLFNVFSFFQHVLGIYSCDNIGGVDSINHLLKAERARVVEADINWVLGIDHAEHS